MGLLDQWNKNKFSIYKNEEKTVLKLIESIGNWVENLITVSENKTDLYGDHKGTWQGFRPSQVDVAITDIIESYGEQLNDIVHNVKNFGAKGDGVTDDTMAIQNCIESLKATGGIVYVPDGIYRVSFLTLYSNISLIGQSLSAKIKQIIGTIPRYRKGDGMIGVNLNDGGTPHVEDNQKNISIKNITLEGNCVESGFRETMAIVCMESVSDILFDNVNFIAPQGDGICIYTGSTTSLERHSERITIRNCLFDGVNYQNRQGISLYDCDGAIIENNYFTRLTSANMPGAIDCEPDIASWNIMKNITIRHNKFYNIGVNGTKPAICLVLPTQSILSTKSQHFIIEDNYCENCFELIVAQTPTSMTDSDTSHDITISNNTVKACTRLFEIYGVKGVNIYHNNANNTISFSRIGFSVNTNCQDVNIVGNIFDKCGLVEPRAIDVYHCDRIKIQNNIFIDIGIEGEEHGTAIIFFTGTSSYVEITDNTFIANDTRMVKTIAINDDNITTPSLNNIKNNKLIGNPMVDFVSTPTFITPVLLNNWVVKGAAYSAFGYYKDNNNLVHLKGSIKRTPSDSGIIYVLPKGYRPSKTLEFIVLADASSTGYLTIDPDGTITLNSSTILSISLEGITFYSGV